MNQSTQNFIQRQFLSLQRRGVNAEEIFNNVLSKALSENDFQTAQNTYQQTGSMLEALNQLNIISIDAEFRELINSFENQKENQLSLLALFETSQTDIKVFQLLKARLAAGLGYAIWVLGIATIIFYVVASKVLPQFEAIFESFGSDLPSLTMFALAWQNSIFPPFLFIVILFAFIIFTLIQAQKTTPTNSSSKLISRFPFIKNIFQYSQSIAWLNQLKILISCGIPFSEALQKLTPLPNILTRISPDISKELNQANQLGTTLEEIDYQIDSLSTQGEKITTNACQNFVFLVMLLVVAFVAFILFASYLPIFKMGSTI